MALDKSAGQKRSVGIARNLYAPDAVVPEVAKPTNLDTPSYTREAAGAVSAQVAYVAPVSAPVAALKPASEINSQATTAKQLGRTSKISFMIDPVLEARFRKARLMAGFEKLEDAYNEALKMFCEKAERKG